MLSILIFLKLSGTILDSFKFWKFQKQWQNTNSQYGNNLFYSRPLKYKNVQSLLHPPKISMPGCTHLAPNLAVSLSAYMPICLSAHLPICLSAHLPICTSAYLPICLSAHLPICPSAYLPICLSAHLPICPFA
jgi:hypothetical protein